MSALAAHEAREPRHVLLPAQPRIQQPDGGAGGGESMGESHPEPGGGSGSVRREEKKVTLRVRGEEIAFVCIVTYSAGRSKRLVGNLSGF